MISKHSRVGNLELISDKTFDNNPSLVVAWKFNAKSDQ